VVDDDDIASLWQMPILMQGRTLSRELCFS